MFFDSAVEERFDVEADAMPLGPAFGALSTFKWCVASAETDRADGPGAEDAATVGIGNGRLVAVPDLMLVLIITLEEACEWG